jgi:hypothetical protein
MLEFIVLGQMPGTSIQLTFGSVVLIGLAFILFILLLRLRGRAISADLISDWPSDYITRQDALPVQLQLFE